MQSCWCESLSMMNVCSSDRVPIALEHKRSKVDSAEDLPTEAHL